MLSDDFESYANDFSFTASNPDWDEYHESLASSVPSGGVRWPVNCTENPCTNKALYQDSVVNYGTNSQVTPTRDRGTILYYNPGIDEQWSDFTLEFRTKTEGVRDNQWGFVFRFTTSENNFHFQWNNDPLVTACTCARLKNYDLFEDGSTNTNTLISEDIAYPLATWIHVRVDAYGNNLKIWTRRESDGDYTLMFNQAVITNDNPVGTIGFTTTAQKQYFDDVLVWIPLDPLDAFTPAMLSITRIVEIEASETVSFRVTVPNELAGRVLYLAADIQAPDASEKCCLTMLVNKDSLPNVFVDRYITKTESRSTRASIILPNVAAGDYIVSFVNTREVAFNMTTTFSLEQATTVTFNNSLTVDIPVNEWVFFQLPVAYPYSSVSMYVEPEEYSGTPEAGVSYLRLYGRQSQYPSPGTNRVTTLPLYDVKTEAKNPTTGVYQLKFPNPSSSGSVFFGIYSAHDPNSASTNFTTAGLNVTAKVQFFPAAPVVDNILPLAIPTLGQTIAITGSNLGSNSGELSITVGGEDCTNVVLNSATSVSCLAPQGQGLNSPVIIHHFGLSSLPGLLDYRSPTVSNINPKTGPTMGDIEVVVTGTNFGTERSVTIGGSDCEVVPLDPGASDAEKILLHSQIRCILPPGQGDDLSVAVNVSDVVATKANLFSYNPPSISPGGISPFIGPTAGGNILSITGENFGFSGSVRVGTVTCNPNCGSDCSWSHSLIQCRLGAGQGEDDDGEQVIVTVAGQSSTENELYFYESPRIDDFNPKTGNTTGGYIMVIEGEHFGTDALVYLGDDEHMCDVQSQNDTIIICEVPSGAGTGLDVIVSVSTRVTSLGDFSYANLELVDLSPDLGPTSGGITISLTGHNFGDASAFVSVKIGQGTCDVLFRNHTLIECELDQGMGTDLDVTIQIADQTRVYADRFSYLPPEISSIPVQRGSTRGGATVTIRGKNFGTSGTVTIGGKPCAVTDLSKYNHTSIQCRLPDGQGSQSPTVVVVQLQVSEPKPYAYGLPAISRVQPSKGGTLGGNTIVVTGSNFGTFGNITLGGRPCDVVEDEGDALFDHGRIECIVPEGEGDDQWVVVTAGGDLPQNSSSLSPETQTTALYSYNKPVVSSYSSDSAPTNGGVLVTIAGSNFGSAQANVSVSIDERECATDDLPRNHTSIVCLSPEGVGEDLPIVVTVEGQESAAANIFSYDAPEITSIDGCSPSQTLSGSVVDCSKNGGDVIIIHGNNFGPLDTTSLIILGTEQENLECTDPVQLAEDPHHAISCTVPRGSGIGKTIKITTPAVEGQTNSLSNVNSGPTVSYAFPRIAGISLDGVEPSPSGDVSVTDINGGQTLIIVGSFLSLPEDHPDFVMPSITYGPSESESPIILRVPPSTSSSGEASGFSTMEENENFIDDGEGVELEMITATFTCEVIEFTSTQISCTLQPGVGQDLRFSISDGQETSAESTTGLTYPKPQVIGATIGETADVSKTMGLTSMTANEAQGQEVYFQAVNVGNDPTLLAIHYGPSTDRTAFECTDVEVIEYDSPSQTSLLFCRSSLGSGTGLSFTVTALNYDSEVGSDVFNYPQIPTISSVSGCEDDGVRTSRCTTQGGVTIEIRGTFFSIESSVRIDGNLCERIEFFDDTHMSCTLPVGAGYNVGVTVFSGSLFSTTVTWLSYAEPTFTTISGCARVDGNSTADCLRAGGNTLQIDGANFGAADAVVLIGAKACSPVIHDVASPHTRLTCTTPPGTNVDRAVLVIQDGGEINRQAATISYAQCQPGTFYNPSLAKNPLDTACVVCPVGTYSALEGTIICESCPPGTYSNMTGNDALSDCTACEAGKYNDKFKQIECQDCIEGSFTESTGQLSCKPCPPGTFSDQEGLDGCRACSTGTFQDEFNSTECKLCVPGTFSLNVRQTSCDVCGVGLFNDVYNSSACQACPDGSFQNTTGQSFCYPCGIGEYNPSRAQRDCFRCPEGFFGNDTGLSQCLECDPGSFQNSRGGDSCELCPLGKYQPSSGQDECISCSPGRFSNRTGLLECDACPAGSFQLGFGATACTDCLPGTAAPNTGNVQCSPCSEGTFQVESGQKRCSSCPVGSFNNIPGQTRCTDCQIGRHGPTVGLTSCLECGVTQFQDKTGNDTCQNCPGDSVATAARTSCECPRFKYWEELRPVCSKCPEGAYCEERGNTFSSLVAKEGYWRARNDSLTFYRCLVRSNCVGGQPEARESTSPCKPHHTGPLCHLCEENYYLTGGDSCSECPEGASSWLFLVGILLIVVIFIWLQLYVVIRSGRYLLLKVIHPDEEISPVVVDHFANEEDPDSRNDAELRAADDREYSVDSDSDNDLKQENGSADDLRGFPLTGSSSTPYGKGGPSSPGRKMHRGDDGTYLDIPQMDGALASRKQDDDEKHADNDKSLDEEEDKKQSIDTIMDTMYCEPVAFQSAAVRDPYNRDILTINGPPRPRANFTYKLKIFVGFAQILANVASGLEVQWPSKFKQFLLWLKLSNFDFMLSSATAVECIEEYDYYDRYLIVVLSPVCIFVSILLFYYVPRYVGCLCFQDMSKTEMLRAKMNFWKMTLFLLFLIYPGVSSTILRHYVCKDIDGTEYLLSDLSQECGTDRWNRYAYWNSLLIFVYPMGVPLFFGVLLWFNRDRLKRNTIQAQFGFLYAGYRDDVWWFEMADSIHKLLLVSFLAFFPEEYQLPAGMVVAGLYVLMLLVMNPYIRESDDRLHLLAQTVIILILLAGHIIYHNPIAEFESREDWLLSLLLAAVTLVFIVYFFHGVFVVLYLKYKRARLMRKTKSVRQLILTSERRRRSIVLAELVGVSDRNIGQPPEVSPNSVQMAFFNRPTTGPEENNQQEGAGSPFPDDGVESSFFSQSGQFDDVNGQDNGDFGVYDDEYSRSRSHSRPRSYSDYSQEAPVDFSRGESPRGHDIELGGDGISGPEAGEAGSDSDAY